MAAREADNEQAGEAALAGKVIENAIADPALESRRDDDPAPTVATINSDAADDTQIQSFEPVTPPKATPAISPAVASATAPAPQVMPIDLRGLIVAIYLAGLTGLAAWWLVGWVALRRVLRAARPAPEWGRGLLREIAGPAGNRVTLLVSPRARQPFTFGWRRAVIVLPTEMCNTALTTPELRWSLAHEWAHVVHHDVRIWSLAGLVRTVYFYQPLCWWLRAQLRLCQDYLADAAAARETSPEAYAEFLTTRAAGRPLAYGLGIAAGKSDLVRRVAMLVKNRKTLESRCPWSWTAALASGALALIFVTATFGDKPPLAAADDQPDAVGAAADGRKTDVKDAGMSGDPANPAQTKPDFKPTESAPSNLAKESADPALQKLLDGMFARATAIKSGRFEVRVHQI